MIKNNCFITPENTTKTSNKEKDTKKHSKKADKIKACILYQAKPKQPPKQEKNAIKKRYFFISL